MTRWLVVGGGAREHAIALTLVRAHAEVVVVSPNANPGLERLARASARLRPEEAEKVAEFAGRERADAAVIGPEAPLATGLADTLRQRGLPTVGPGQSAARLESSKAFCRELLARHGVGAQPRFAIVGSAEEVDREAASFPGPFVVKPSGLTAGKGVWVQGADFPGPKEGAAYAKTLVAQGGKVLLEEKLEGEEFSLMAFVTDNGVWPMPAVQDFKRALEGDEGPNTGGMGSYSQRDHLLPFLRPADRDHAFHILESTVAALRAEGLPYRGILYGGFMLTAQGPRLLEFNVRFGDPEGINVLTLYEEGNFSDLLLGVASGRVDPNLVRFRRRSTVVRYLVPPGYGSHPVAGGLVELDEGKIEAEGVHVVYGSVDAAGPAAVRLGTSRGVALVGEASAIHEAAARVESALRHVRGDVYVRHDIGTQADLARRWEHVRQLLAPGAAASPLPLSVAPPDAAPSSSGPPEQLTG
ncbi:MAG TPA: phosphoribosylamine--glycine ligase [Thermoplasmata archaeon]|nr:phosphoribosylamine--glycine ligase [Thermoplasmata archaeon]